MSERIQIEISARDNASRVFGQVGQAVDTMGDRLADAQRELAELKQEGVENQRTLEDLRRQAQDTGRGLDDLGDDADEAGRSLRDMQSEVRNIGAGIGVLLGAMALSGQAFRDQEVAVATLERRYGESADMLREFADEIQNTTNYSNDAAIASANLAGTLTQSYGFTAEQIRQLIQVSADLAASSTTISGQQLTLEDATQRVTAAMRGEAESAELLGLTLNDRALGIDRMAASTTDAEKAQIRWNALLEQSAFSLGAAAEQADTTYGSMTRLKNEVNDAAQSLGQMLGPLGEVGAFAADNAIKMGLFTLGLTQLGRAALATRTLLGATGLTGAFVGSAGLVGAIGVAALALREFEGNLEGSYTNSVRIADQATKDLDETVRQLFATGNQLASLGEQAQGLFPDVQADIERMRQLEGLISTMQAQGGPQTDQQRQALTEYIAELDTLVQTYGAVDSATLESTEYAALFANAQSSLNEILSNTGVGARDQQAALQGLIDLYHEGALGPVVLAESIINLADDTDYYNERATAAAAATEALASGMRELSPQTQIAADNWNELSVEAARAESQMSAIELQEFRLTSTTDDLNESLTDHSDLLRIVADNYNEMSVAAAQFEGQQARGRAQLALTADAYREVSVEAARAQAQMSGTELQEFLLTDAAERAEAEAEAIREGTQAISERIAEYQRLEAAIPGPVEQLENVFRVVVGNTNAIAQSSQQVQKWADDLIGAVGVWSEMDEMLARGTIDINDYNHAQEAQIRITEANAVVQENMNALQVEWAGLVADAAVGLADYTTHLRTLPEDQQAAALAAMDTATSMRAIELAAFATSGASQEAMDAIIGGAIAADPFLGALLEQMGIIATTDAEGNVSVSVKGESEMAALTTAINALDATFNTLLVVDVDRSALDDLLTGAAAAGFPMGGDVGGQGASVSSLEVKAKLTIDKSEFDSGVSDATTALSTFDSASGEADVLADNSDATSKISESQSALSRWGSSSATAQILANNGQAMGAIASVSSALAALNNRRATTYIDTVYRTFGSAPAVGLGGVAGYATGGVVAEMAEWGPELLHFPNGGVALAPTRGTYMVPQGTYVDTAPTTASKLTGGVHVNVQVFGNVIGIDDLTLEVTRQMVPALERAASEYRRGYA